MPWTNRNILYANWAKWQKRISLAVIRHILNISASERVQCNGLRAELQAFTKFWWRYSGPCKKSVSRCVAHAKTIFHVLFKFSQMQELRQVYLSKQAHVQVHVLMAKNPPMYISDLHWHGTVGKPRRSCVPVGMSSYDACIWMLCLDYASGCMRADTCTCQIIIFIRIFVWCHTVNSFQPSTVIMRYGAKLC